jgi:ribosomal protein S13
LPFISPKTNHVDNTDVINGKLIDITKTIDRVALAVVKTDSASLLEQLTSLELEKKQLVKELDEEKLKNIPSNLSEEFTTIESNLDTKLKDNVFRAELRNFIRKVITKITVTPTGYSIHFVEGSIMDVDSRKESLALIKAIRDKFGDRLEIFK